GPNAVPDAAISLWFRSAGALQRPRHTSDRIKSVAEFPIASAILATCSPCLQLPRQAVPRTDPFPVQGWVSFWPRQRGPNGANDQQRHLPQAGLCSTRCPHASLTSYDPLSEPRGGNEAPQIHHASG